MESEHRNVLLSITQEMTKATQNAMQEMKSQLMATPLDRTQKDSVWKSICKSMQLWYDFEMREVEAKPTKARR